MKSLAQYSLFFDVAKNIGQKLKYQKFLADAHQKYDLRPFKIHKMTSSIAKKLFNGINARYQRGELQVSPTGWYENERRLFIWFSVCYEEVHKVQLLQSDQDVWKQFSKIFHNKDPIFLEFQYRNLLKTKNRQKWTTQQDNFLRQAVKKQKPGQWNQISKQIFFSSQRDIFKTPKQCRERWFNHLDQSKTKSQWTNKEDLKMLQYILQNGTKWSKMVPHLNNKRTQHQIKNRFNSITNNAFKGKKDNIQFMNSQIEDMIASLQKNIIEDQQQEEKEQQQQEVEKFHGKGIFNSKNKSKRKSHQKHMSTDQEIQVKDQNQDQDQNQNQNRNQYQKTQKLEKIVQEDDQQNNNGMKDLQNYVKQQESLGNNNNNNNSNKLNRSSSLNNNIQNSSERVSKKGSFTNCLDFENYGNDKSKFGQSPLPFILYDAKSPIEIFGSPMPGFPRIHTPGGFFDQAALFKNSFDQWKSIMEHTCQDQKSFTQECMRIPTNDLSMEYNKLTSQDPLIIKKNSAIEQHKFAKLTPDRMILKPSSLDIQLREVQEMSHDKKILKKKWSEYVSSSANISQKDQINSPQ